MRKNLGYDPKTNWVSTVHVIWRGTPPAGHIQLERWNTKEKLTVQLFQRLFPHPAC